MMLYRSSLLGRQVEPWLNYTAAIFHPKSGEEVREPSEQEAEVLSCATAVRHVE